MHSSNTHASLVTMLLSRNAAAGIGRLAAWRHSDVRGQVAVIGGRRQSWWLWDAGMTVAYKNWHGDTARTNWRAVHWRQRRRRRGGDWNGTSAADFRAACRRLLRLVSVILEPNLYLRIQITNENVCRPNQWTYWNIASLGHFQLIRKCPCALRHNLVASVFQNQTS